MINKPVSDLECTPVNPNVFAKAENRGVALHFFPNTLANGFKIRYLGHDRESLLRSPTGVVGGLSRLLPVDLRAQREPAIVSASEKRVVRHMTNWILSAFGW